MAGRTLDELTATTTLAETDLLYSERAAGSRKITVADFRDVMGGHGLAQLYMIDNATPTTTTDAGTFYKIAGTTTAGLAEDFTLTSNRATYSGPREYIFRVTVIGSLVDGNNKVIAVRVARNGTALPVGEGRATTSSGGSTSTIVASTFVTLAPGDYVEAWVANLTSGGGTTTAVDLNLIVERV
jgi:hypothetical protein